VAIKSNNIINRSNKPKNGNVIRSNISTKNTLRLNKIPFMKNIKKTTVTNNILVFLERL
jgi:hypothetical protein